MGINSLSVIKWWVNYFYEGNKYLKCNTVAIVSLVEGTNTSVFLNKNSNTPISIGIQLIGTDDTLPLILWINYFGKHQVYEIKYFML